MPQIEQLPLIFFSQLFWLAVVFGIIFFGIGRGMLPKIQSTIELREKRIADDLAQAQEARAAAERTEEAWRTKMDEARAEAARLSQDARQKSAQDTEAKVQKAAEKINLKVEAAEMQIREAAASARTEIEAVASDAARDMVARLTGLQLGADETLDAVKAELNG